MNNETFLIKSYSILCASNLSTFSYSSMLLLLLLLRRRRCPLNNIYIFLKAPHSIILCSEYLFLCCCCCCCSCLYRKEETGNMRNIRISYDLSNLLPMLKELHNTKKNKRIFMCTFLLIHVIYVNNFTKEFLSSTSKNFWNRYYLFK